MKIVLVDDDALVCASLKTIIESTSNIEVVETGKNGIEAVKLYEKYKPDILLMDIRMDKMTGIEAAKNILSKFKNSKILFLTTFSDDEYIVEALRMGVKGYILKQHYENIVLSLNAVYNGQNVYGDEVIKKIPDMLNNKSQNYSAYGIIEKEFEIIKYIADGYSNKEISAKMFLSEGTIRNYISIILEKLELRDRTQIAIFYYKNLI